MNPRNNDTFPQSQEKIDNLIAEKLNNIHFTMMPKYDGKVKGGFTKVSISGISAEVKVVKIGKQASNRESALLDIILHEELEARIAVRANRHWGGAFGEMLEKNKERHEYIYAVLARYFRIRGW